MMIRGYDKANISLHFFSPYVYIRRKMQNQVVLHQNMTGDCISITGKEDWINELLKILNDGCDIEQLIALFQVNDEVSLQEMIIRGFIE